MLPRPQFVVDGPRRKRRVPGWKPNQPWSDTLYRSWRRNVYKPTRLEVGASAGKPYDGRHSFASLLLHEGRNVAYVAEQVGDSIDTVQRHYPT